MIVETPKPLSRSQQREALRLVRGALDEAKRAEIITTNPADEAPVGGLPARGAVGDDEREPERGPAGDEVASCRSRARPGLPAG